MNDYDTYFMEVITFQKVENDLLVCQGKKNWGDFGHIFHRSVPMFMGRFGGKVFLVVTRSPLIFQGHPVTHFPLKHDCWLVEEQSMNMPRHICSVDVEVTMQRKFLSHLLG